MFTKSSDHKINYLASIVKLTNVRRHNGADRLQCVSLFGNNVITGLTAKDDDLYCYFPLECAISVDFLKFTNSFREKTSNTDTNVAGFFEYHGRVRAVKLRGERSEGYIVPVSELERFAKEILGKDLVITDKHVGSDFDLLFDHVFCKKYIPKGTYQGDAAGKKTRGNVKRYASKLVEKQFAFHPSTEQLKRNMHKVQPDDYVAITEKYHGTSFVVSNVIIKKNLTWKDRIAKFFKVNVVDTEYGMLYSSRSVIKNVSLDNDKENNHFYDSDVWKIVADKLYPSLKHGYSFYGEIVGYTPTGKMIQSDYDYGCPVGSLDYIVYRMTYTNVIGDVHELSHHQMIDYCDKFGIKTPLVHFYGKIKDLYPQVSVNEHWHENVLAHLINDYLEKDCIFCNTVPNTPAEGVIMRVDKPNAWEVYKLKSFRFLEKESKFLDQGVIDLEEAQQQESAEDNVESPS